MAFAPVPSRHERSSRQLTLALAALSIVLAAGSPAAAVNGIVFERIALTGDQAPGTPAGVVFSGFTGPYTHPEPGPRIDAQGRVSFFAFISGPGVTTANHSGIWSQASGQLGLDARAGMQAAGAPAGVLFRAFTDDFAPSTPAIGNARTGFSASLVGSGVSGMNLSGIWGGGGGALQLLARMGSQAPGTPSGTVFTDPLYLLDTSDAGHMLVSGRLTGSGVTEANGDGFWSDRSGPLSLILREGQQAPGLPAGVVFGAGPFLGSPYPFPIVRSNEAAELAFQGNLLGPGVTTFSNEAIFAERDGQFRLILREGDPAPGAGPGATFGGDSILLHTYELSFNTLGQVAFDVMLGGTMSGTTLLYSDHRGTLEPVLMPGDPAPGTAGEFGIIAAPRLSNGGRLAFRAALSDAGTWPPIGIWWDQTGPLTALAVPGQQVPGRPAGTTIASTHWVDGFNTAGQLAFRAGIFPAGGGLTMGLFLADPNGNLRLVVETGTTFDVAGDGSDMRTIGEITPGGLSEGGVLPFRLDFTNGTSGIFTASVARAPGASNGLWVQKGQGGQLLLTWEPDCGGGTRYGIYRGDIDAGISSTSAAQGYCAVSGTTASIPSGFGTAEFFLVVPSSGGYEGSYGTNHLGAPRPQASVPCYPRDQVDICGP